MSRFLIYLTVSLLPFSAFAQWEPGLMTVVAPSGLSIRSAPGLDAERITIIPVGAKVRVLDLDELPHKQLEPIDGYYGYWAKVSYQETEGYVFSAYLYEGQQFIEATNINNDYRVFSPGWRCDLINYDPELNWYAWLRNDQQQLVLKKQTPDFKMAADNPYDIPPYAFCTAFEVGVKEQANQDVFLFLGTRHTLDLSKINPGKTHFKDSSYYNSGILPFPYQHQNLTQHGAANYYLLGYEDYVKSEFSERWYRNYQLYLSTHLTAPYAVQPQGQLLSSLLRMEEDTPDEYTEYESSYYEHAGIVWQGDLNGDHFPDCLFYRPDTSERCGGSEYYFLLLSEQQPDGTFQMKKVAEESVFSCS